MKANQLRKHAEECQMEADSMAYLILEAKRLILLQPICDFDVWWMHDLSPVMMHEESIDFLIAHKDKFKRKINAREFILYDYLIFASNIKTFDDFREVVRISRTPELWEGKIEYLQQNQIQ